MLRAVWITAPVQGVVGEGEQGCHLAGKHRLLRLDGLRITHPAPRRLAYGIGRLPPLFTHESSAAAL